MKKFLSLGLVHFLSFFAALCGEDPLRTQARQVARREYISEEQEHLDRVRSSSPPRATPCKPREKIHTTEAGVFKSLVFTEYQFVSSWHSSPTSNALNRGVMGTIFTLMLNFSSDDGGYNILSAAPAWRKHAENE